MQVIYHENSTFIVNELKKCIAKETDRSPIISKWETISFFLGNFQQALIGMCNLAGAMREWFRRHCDGKLGWGSMGPLARDRQRGLQPKTTAMKMEGFVISKS